ncbi:hypothetical protein SH139x_001292 [Planctomycetaceae bacterium SH139]
MNRNSYSTPQLERLQLRKFTVRCFIFLLLVATVCLPGLVVLARSGESFYNIESALRLIEEKPVLVGFAYNEDNYGFLKQRRLATMDRQDVVALGSSRVLEFREEMFRCSFYNAGYTISPITEFREFTERLPAAHHPKILIIGLDQWMFNTRWIEGTLTSPDRWTINTSTDIEKGFRSLPKVYKDLVRGRVPLTQPNSPVTLIGLNAVSNLAGFRNDGSFDYGNRITQLLTTDPLGVALPAPKGRRFVGGDHLDEQAVNELAMFLADCQNQGIHVIGFVPPMMDRVLEHLRRSGQHGYLNELAARLRPLFLRHRFEFYSFESMSTIGSDDSEAIDLIHGSDVTYLRILLAMVDQGSEIATCVDRNQLATDLAKRRNRYQVYPASAD